MTFVIYTNPEKFDLLKWISDLVCIKFDIVFIVAYRVLALLTLYVDEWIKCVRRLDNGNNNEPIEFNCEKLLKTYDNIIKCYELFKKVFQISVKLIVRIRQVHFDIHKSFGMDFHNINSSIRIDSSLSQYPYLH